MNRRDSVQVNRDLRVVLHHLELRMGNDDARSAALRLSIHDEPLAARDHFLDPVRIEPAAHERLAEHRRLLLFEHDVEHFLPAANALHLRFFHESADAHRLLAVAVREAVESRAILVATREVREQIPDRVQTEAFELARALRRDAVEFAQWCLQNHRRINHSAARTCWIWICRLTLSRNSLRSILNATSHGAGGSSCDTPLKKIAACVLPFCWS